MLTGKEMAAAILEVIKPHFAEQIKAVEARFAEAIKAIPPAEKGADAVVDYELIGLEVAKRLPPIVDRAQAVLSERLEQAIKEIPTPKDGSSVTLKDVEPLVVETVAKAVGALPPAKNGDPGRDAAQIEVLSSIDEDRAYARNTWASYKGGLIRSVRTTDYLDTLKPGETIESKGWHVILNGPAETVIEQLDERTFSIKCEQTNGKVVEKKVVLPVVIDRGIFKEGQAYAKGDGVTFGGSFWIAQVDAPKGKPGDPDSGFRLAVKKGRDGKDAK